MYKGFLLLSTEWAVVIVQHRTLAVKGAELHSESLLCIAVVCDCSAPNSCCKTLISCWKKKTCHGKVYVGWADVLLHVALIMISGQRLISCLFVNCSYVRNATRTLLQFSMCNNAPRWLRNSVWWAKPAVVCKYGEHLSWRFYIICRLIESSGI